MLVSDKLNYAVIEMKNENLKQFSPHSTYMHSTHITANVPKMIYLRTKILGLYTYLVITASFIDFILLFIL